VSGSDCYFDTNDSGPDQCTPAAGRWESSGGCHWNPYGSGEDECLPEDEPEVCYSDGVADDCPTQQDLDDVAASFSAALNELDAIKSAMDAEESAWCSQNPGECLENAAIASGPSTEAGFQCAGEYLEAAGRVTGAAFTIGFLWGLSLAPGIGVLDVIGLGALGGAVAAAAAGSVKNAYDCWKAREPIPHHVVPVAEPVYY
jgi:hypothetical protein